MNRRILDLDPDGRLTRLHKPGDWSSVLCAGPYRMGSRLVACSAILYQTRPRSPRDGAELKRCPECKSWNVVEWYGYCTKVTASAERPDG